MPSNDEQKLTTSHMSVDVSFGDEGNWCMRKARCYELKLGDLQ